MKKLFFIMVIVVAMHLQQALAQSGTEQLLGEWNGQVGSESSNVVIIFNFEMKDSDEITGSVKIRGSAGEGLSIDDITVDEIKVHFRFNNNKSEYLGVLSGDRIEGQLTQAGTTIPLSLNRGKYVNPYALNLSTDEMSRLNGEWHGEINFPDGPLLVFLRFGNNSAGEFIGLADAPYHTDFNLPVTDVSLDNEKLEFQITRLAMTFNGKLEENEISGTSSMRIRKLPVGNFRLTMEKGHYEVPDYSCNLPDDAADKLLGTWEGRISPPGRTMSNIFHAEKRADGKVYCFYDNPDIGIYGQIMVNQSWEDGRMSFNTIYPRDAEFKANLSDNRITGNWYKGGIRVPARYEKVE